MRGTMGVSGLQPPVIWRGAVREVPQVERAGAVDPIQCIEDGQRYLVKPAEIRRLASQARRMAGHEYAVQRCDLLRHREIGVFCAFSRPFCASSCLSSCPSSLAHTLAQ